MFLAPLQRIVHSVRSKEETRSDDSRLVLHVLLPAISSYYLWSSMCCAWSAIHSRTVKPFTVPLVSGTMSYCLFSLGNQCTLSVVLTHRKHTTSSSLSVTQPCSLGLRFSVAPSLYRPCYSGSPVQKRDSVGSATTKSYFQTDAENYAGNLKPHPFGWQPAEYVLQRITLSLTSSPGLWLCAAFAQLLYMHFAPGWAWHHIRNKGSSSLPPCLTGHCASRQI